MTPAKPQIPFPPNYAVPNFIPGKFRLPADFKLWPDAFFPDLKAASLPVTPPIPPDVASGDVITANHENTVSTAINDLWINDQWIAANMLSNPTTAKGDLIVNDGTALVRVPVGANSQVLVADSTQPMGVHWAAQAPGGVGTVFGRSGAVVAVSGDYTAAQVTNAVSTIGSYADPAWITSLAWSKVSGAPAFTPASRQVIAGAGLTGGGPLTADVTLSAHAFGASGASHALGSVPDPGATAGATRYLREDATWAIPAGSGGGLTDPTTTLGDILVRGSAAVTRLGVGANGQALLADSMQPLGVRWGTVTGGGSQTPWTDNIDGAGFYLDNTSYIGVTGDDAQISITTSSMGGSFSIADDNPDGQATIFLANDINSSFAIGLQGSNGQGDPNLANVAALDCWGDGTPTTFRISVEQTERLRIVPAGRVLINQPVDDGTSALQVLGVIRSSTGGFKFPDGTVQTTAATTGGGGSQTPWTSNINAAHFSLANVGNIAAGNDGTVLPSVNTDINVTIGSTSAAAPLGRLNLVNNQSSVTGVIGQLAFCNYAISVADKRVASINGFNDGATNSGALAFNTMAAGVIGEKMRVTSAGNVGIGTSAPDSLLTLSNNSAALPAVLAGNVIHAAAADGSPARITVDSFGSISNVTVRSAGGTGAAPTALALNAALGSFAFFGRGATAYSSSARALISGSAAEAWTDTAQGTYLTFSTTAIGTVSNAERMRIDPSGNVGIGTTTPNARLEITGPDAPSSGSGALLVTGPTTNSRLAIGYNVTGDYAWMQAQHVGTNWMPLLLNPQGGDVGIGLGAAAPQYPLDVGGGIHCGSLTLSSALKSASGVGTIVITSTDATGPLQATISLLGGGSPRLAIQCVEQTVSFRPITLNEGGGNVGISTSAPTHLLHLTASATTASSPNTTLYIQRNAGGAFAGFGISGVVSVHPCLYSPIGTDDWAFGFDNATSVVERLRITAAGNIGVGIAAPGGTVDISSATGSDTAGSAHKLRFSFNTTGLFGFRMDAANNNLVFDAFWSAWTPIMSWVRSNGMLILNAYNSGTHNYASDAAAASGGVPLGGVYHNAGILRVRIA